MPDTLGYRAKWGLIIPSTNTTCEADFWYLAPHGITVHSGRAMIFDPNMSTNEAAMHVIDQMDDGFDRAVEEAMSVQPDRVLLAMAAEVMRRGVEGGAKMIADLEAVAGVPVSSGPDASVEALRALGAKKIAFLTPYQPGSDQISIDYFTAFGFEIVAVKGLRCQTAHAIAQVTKQEVMDGLAEVNVPGVDAILQIGTALPIVPFVAEAEELLGTPVVAMNTATAWSALRHSGFDDVIPNAGILLSEH